MTTNKPKNTDQDLLELAAKAAGYEYSAQGGYIVVGGIPGNWNPLFDDGDAFRLASDLNLTVDFGNNMVASPEEAMGPGTDPYAATRRAIVRAAAEMGRDKP